MRLLSEIFHAEQLAHEIIRLLTVDTEHRNQQADAIIQRLQLMVADPNSDIAHVAQQSGIDTMRLIEISESRMITAKELRQLTSVEY
jgi:2-keto-3-deoxy-L-rhamnonate aldolase RhmA